MPDKKITTFRPLFVHLSQVSSVTMPASLPPQLADLHQKPSAPVLTFFIRWTLSIGRARASHGPRPFRSKSIVMRLQKTSSLSRNQSKRRQVVACELKVVLSLLSHLAVELDSLAEVSEHHVLIVGASAYDSCEIVCSGVGVLD